MDERFATAFAAALTRHHLDPAPAVDVHVSALHAVPAATRFDVVVSPANSHGRLDGGFDDALSRAFSPRDDYLALTRVAQRTLYRCWRGFAPPGTCTLVRIPAAFDAPRSRNVWAARYLALCPTMRTPGDAAWDREVVYEAVWSLLVAIDRHNEAVAAGAADDGDVEIRSLLMPPLATGTGRVSADRWAHQCVLAMKHFVAAKREPAKWSALTPADMAEQADEVAETWAM